MAEIWVTAIGVAVTAAGTAYSINSQNNAISAANNAHPRAFVPIDINNVAQQAFIADKAGFDISDKDWQKRFPQLFAGRNYNISDIGGNLRGIASPTITKEMNKAGLGANLGNTEFKQAQNLGLPLLSLEQRDRNYFQKELSMNPQRTAGLTGQDVARISIANTNSQSNFNQGLFGSRISAYNSQIQQGIANNNAAIGGLGALAGLYTNYQQQNTNPASNPLDPHYYGGDSDWGRTGAWGATGAG